MKKTNWIYTKSKKFRFRLTDWRASSHKFGPCELCKKHVNDVYHLTIEEQIEDTGGKFFTQHFGKVGHEECLRKHIKQHN